MRYYVVADIHGFYTQLIKALQDKGYFDDDEPHKLIVCGDLFDRGTEARELQSFMLDLIEKDEVILIRGNHEDLYLDLVRDYPKIYHFIEVTHHYSNGTFSTACQLTNHNAEFSLFHPTEMHRDIMKVPFVTDIIPKMKNYFETKNYIFVHGWVPCRDDSGNIKYRSNWRTARKADWAKARWENGMRCAMSFEIPKKTVVCGHWNASFGHCNIEGMGSEYGNDAIHTPYYGNGIIAIDACTVKSGFVNCVVIEDDPLK